MNKKIRRRLLVIQVLFILLFAGVIGKLAYIHLFEAEALKDEVQNQKNFKKTIFGSRGMVLDRNGAKLAFTMVKYTVTIDTNRLSSDKMLDYAVGKIAEVISMEKEDIYEIINDSEKTSIKITDIYDKYEAEELRSLYLSGVWIDRQEYRKYPNDELAAQVLGFTRGEGEQKIGYGVEIQFDEELIEIDGRVTTEKDKWYNELVYATRTEVPARDGNNITLTIDHVMQYYLEKALKEGYEIHNPIGAHAIMMDVNTGEILAMGSYPTFNPNELSVIQGVTNEELKVLVEEGVSEGDLLTMRWKNHMVQDNYELGSTLKLVTTAIALEENIATPDTKFNIGNKIQVADKVIKCWYYPHSHGEETLTQAVENSCNPVFVELGRLIGKNTFYDYFEDFGLTESTGINLPYETSPIVYSRENAHEVELATMTFGHGISNSPIQVITAISALVNGGYLLEPHVIKKVEDADGNIIEEAKRTVKRQVISEITSTQMRGIMRSVVENGSGHAVLMEGIPIGAKTGTSEKPYKGGYSSEKVIASFIAVAPIDDPQIALFVFVDEPEEEKYGSVVAGPIARAILDNILPYMGMEKNFETVTDIVNVPNLLGMTYGEAKKMLEEIGLNYMTTPVNIEDESKIIINQYPKAGTPVKINEPINIYINE